MAIIQIHTKLYTTTDTAIIFTTSKVVTMRNLCILLKKAAAVEQAGLSHAASYVAAAYALLR
jgi:hypothetical protein